MKSNVIIAIETLLSGGAELFVVRMANALVSHCNVSLTVVNGDMMDKRLINSLSPQINLIPIHFLADKVVRKLDSLLMKLKIDFSIREFLVIQKVRRMLARETDLVLHTNQFKTDYIFAKANQHIKLKHIITIHGDYINFYKQFQRNKVRILHYPKKAKWVLSAVDSIVYISDHQIRFFLDEWNLKDFRAKAKKIYNGLDAKTASTYDQFKSNFIKKDFVFGMVARGIPEKGWEVAIRAFLSLKRSGAQLILVGEGPHLDYLKNKYHHSEIYFTGYSSNPIERIALFDVGLLPTTFSSESLPTSIIEYLLMGKVVVAADMGEIRNMIVQNGKEAGIILPVSGGIIGEKELANAMRRLMDDKDLYARFAQETKHHARIFDMRICVDGYLDLYRK